MSRHIRGTFSYAFTAICIILSIIKSVGCALVKLLRFVIQILSLIKILNLPRISSISTSPQSLLVKVYSVIICSCGGLRF